MDLIVLIPVSIVLILMGRISRSFDTRLADLSNRMMLVNTKIDELIKANKKE